LKQKKLNKNLIFVKLFLSGFYVVRNKNTIQILCCIPSFPFGTKEGPFFYIEKKKTSHTFHRSKRNLLTSPLVSFLTNSDKPRPDKKSLTLTKNVNKKSLTKIHFLFLSQAFFVYIFCQVFVSVSSFFCFTLTFASFVLLFCLDINIFVSIFVRPVKM